MLGIITTLLTMEIAGASAYAVGDSIKSFGASESRTEDKENLPILNEKSPDGISSVDCAYYDKKNKKFVARIYCYFDRNKSWVEADNMEDLRKRINEIYKINISSYEILFS